MPKHLVPSRGGDEGFDGGLQIDDALQCAALETSLGEEGEEDLAGVEPTDLRKRAVQYTAQVAAEPSYHLLVFVVGVVVENGLDGWSYRLRPRARRRWKRMNS
jgi:hypothetical protein